MKGVRITFDHLGEVGHIEVGADRFSEFMACNATVKGTIKEVCEYLVYTETGLRQVEVLHLNGIFEDDGEESE